MAPSVDERLGRMLEHVSDGIAFIGADWRVLYVNPRAAQLLHRQPQELIGEPLWELFPDAVDSVFWDLYHRTMTAQVPEVIEAYYGPLDGWFEVRVFPAPEGLTVYFRDVTDARAADEERQGLIARLSASLRRSEQLRGLTDALARAFTLEEVADLVTQHAKRSLGCRFAGLALIDEDRSVMRYVSMAPLPERVVDKWTEFPLDLHVPAADAARRGTALLFGERAEIAEAYPDIAADLEAAGTQGMANLPLVVSGRTIGALMTTWAEPHVCEEEELQFLETLAGQAAQAVERAQLFARQQSVAATLQQAILPRQLPSRGEVSLAARYEPAETGVDVGGDWYDAFELDGDRLALTVGDVAGHGLNAAALMGQLRNATRAYAVDALDPGELLTKLNRLLLRSVDSMLSTIVFVVLELRTGAIRWSNAGHPPPLVVPSAGSARFLEEVHGPPLGTDATTTYGQSHGGIAGQALLLYTDGLIEHRRRSLSEGLARLQEVAASASLGDLERLCDDVARRVLPTREDDMCVLAARHRGAA